MRIFPLILLLNIFAGIAQQGHQGRRHFNLEKFKQQRAEFLIQEIGLTESEAKEFIPLCNELMKKKYELNKSVRILSRNLERNPNKKDKDFEEIVDRVIDNKLQEAQLEKEYYRKFKEILSAEKIYKYQKSEMKFMRKTVRNADQEKRHGRNRKN